MMAVRTKTERSDDADQVRTSKPADGRLPRFDLIDYKNPGFKWTTNYVHTLRQRAALLSGFEPV